MQFEDIIGYEPTKKHLINSFNLGRIPHAQIFSGPAGSGKLEMALCYANLLLNNKVQNHTQHPDLHFAFPVATTADEKGTVTSDGFMVKWHEFVVSEKYPELIDWMDKLEIAKKQGNISVHEIAAINKKLSLKSYEGGYKVMIIWQAEKMNTIASNKLLKNLEEPLENTVFILIVENPNELLQTIKSRCQEINLLAFTQKDVISYLQKHHQLGEESAKNIALQCEGNLNKAIHLVKNDTNDLMFENWFIYWVRAAFKAMKHPGVIVDLLNWSADIAKENREIQKNFLKYCIRFFRQALIANYKVNNLIYLQTNTENFKLENFAPFVHSGNINEIYNLLNDSIYQIERNGNANLIFTDLSIKLTKFLHKKETI